jgi:hypothetical protein
MSFKWNTSPDVFNLGFAEYWDEVMDALYALMVEYAPIIQQFMRENAPWKDSCMPGREYLIAEAWRDSAANEVGILAYYDLETYRRTCPEPDWDWGWAHEQYTFKKAGVIAIILPRGAVSVLGDMADELWDRVRVLFGGAAVSRTSTGIPF